MCNNYVKVVAQRPSQYIERLASFIDSPQAKQFEEYWFFDDADPVSISAALQRCQAFQNRQPPGIRMSVSVYRPIASAQGLPTVGEPVPMRGLRAA